MQDAGILGETTAFRPPARPSARARRDDLADPVRAHITLDRRHQLDDHAGSVTAVPPSTAITEGCTRGVQSVLFKRR